jgi:hypothetical protein
MDKPTPDLLVEHYQYLRRTVVKDCARRGCAVCQRILVPADA